MRKVLTATVLMLLAASALATGDIYRWKDANGTWHYSDLPQPGAELVHRSSSATDSASSAAPAEPAQPPADTTDAAGLPPVSDEVASQVRQEAATAKTAQCKQAQDNYQKAIQARIFTKKDEKGNQVRMTSAEIDAFRLQARSLRDVACGPGN